MLDLLIRGGTVVAPDLIEALEIGIKDGLIEFVSKPGVVNGKAQKVIDASDKIVIPGGVEAHAHIHEPMYKGWTRGEEMWLQSPEAASRAAAFGGTTTVASFAFMGVHTKVVEFDANIAVQHRRSVFADHSYVDYVFHPVLTGTPSEQTLGTVVEAIEDGTTSFKVFTTDVTTGQDGIKIDDGSILELMKIVAARNGILVAHAENDELVKHMEAKLAQGGNDHWYNLHLVHSSLSEDVAFYKMIRFAKETGAGLYLVHVTAETGVEAIAAARGAGLPIYGEVLHNYLCYTAENYKEVDGMKYQTYPALKKESDRRALWQGLADGTLATIATDEYTTPFKIKTQGRTIATACGGHAGIETRGMIAFSEGYSKEKFSLRRFVDLFSTNPARILGLYPQKGAIMPGSDADIVLWDPHIKKKIELSDLHHDSDYSIWEGWEVDGWPVMTILRGNIIIDDSKLLGSSSDGQFVKRKMLPDVISGPV